MMSLGEAFKDPVFRRGMQRFVRIAFIFFILMAALKWGAVQWVEHVYGNH